jgi:stage II sporulation protein D
MFFNLVFIMAMYQAPAFADNFDSEMVRVRLKSVENKIEISGLAVSVQGEEKTSLFVALSPISQKLTIMREARAGKNFWRVTQAGIPVARVYADKYLYIHGEGLHLGAARMPSKIILSPAKKIDVIGLVPMKDYLYGVLAKEMPASWPNEALKAQAIAARSYARAVMKERHRLPYDVESNIFDQVFDSDQAEIISRTAGHRIKEAVDQTADQVLLNLRKQIVKAFYHADCGGRTSSAASVFGVAGVAGGIVDQSCPSNPLAKWTMTVPQGELIGKILPQAKDHLSISSMELLRPSDNERVKNVRFFFSGGETKVFSVQMLREALGFQRLKSAFFQAKVVEGNVVFSGSGYGHGVGMCQWGSKFLAAQGASFSQILRHYYPQENLGSSAPIKDQRSFY